MSEVILRSSPESKQNTSRSKRFAARGKKTISTIITVFLAAATIGFGLGISGTPATSVSAAYAEARGMTECLIPGMDPEGPNSKSKITASWAGAIGNIRANFDADKQNIQANAAIPTSSGTFTAYEWYGVSGFQFFSGTWFKDTSCSRFSQLAPLNAIASMLQSGTNFFGEALLGIISLTMNASVVKDLIAGEDSIASKIIASLQDSLYLQWIVPIIILAGAAIAYSGLVKKRGTEAVQGTVWVIISAALALVFFSQPTQIASWADDTVVSLGNEIMVATATAASGAVSEADSLCSVEGNYAYAITPADLARAQELNNIDKRTGQLRKSQCILWKTFIYEPWAAAQFGSLANDTNILVPESAAATFRGDRTLPIVFLDNRVLNRAEVVTGNIREDNIRDTQWDQFKKTMQDPSAKAGWANFSGVPQDMRLGPALIGFVGMAAGLGPITFLSITLVVQQVFMLLLLLIAPVVFTIGIFPGRGRKIMLGWFEIFLSTILKRFIAYLLIAILLVALTVVMSTQANSSSFLLQIALVAGIGFGTLFLRKIILEKFGTVNLGGDGGKMLRKIGQGTMSEAKSDYKKGRGMVTQPVAAFGKAIGKNQSVGKALWSATKNVKSGYQTGGPSVAKAASKVYEGTKDRKATQTKEAVKEAAKREAKEKADFDARAQITEKRQQRKASERTIKGNARLNSNLEEFNKNIGGGVPKRPDMSKNADSVASEGIGSSAGREADYDASLNKMQEKLEAIELRKQVLEDWKSQLDSGVDSGQYDLSEARERKNIIQNELYGLYEESELIQRKLDKTEGQ
jgi:hypothetical protein